MDTDRSATARPLPPSDTPAAALLPELEAVETRLQEQLRSRETRISEISRHLIGAGGKRTRPAVTLLAFHACGGAAVDDAVDIAVALELIHSASLLHDDIIDDSRTRRGRDSARHQFGVADTLVTGDFLFSRAFQLCGRFDESIVRWASDACIALTEGEVMQGRFRHNPQVTLADYVEIVERKTAALFETGARIAAHLADPRAGDSIAALARCGKHVGITFQMVDDLLDVTSDEQTLGKPVGLDVREGNPSLPIVLAIESDPEIASLFAKTQLSEGEVSAVLSRLRRSSALDKAYALARDHARAGHDALQLLPDTPYRAQLHQTVDHLVERIS